MTLTSTISWTTWNGLNSLIASPRKRNKAVKLHRSAKKEASANQMEAKTAMAIVEQRSLDHSAQFVVSSMLAIIGIKPKQMTIIKQQGQANKPFNRTFNNKPPQQHTYTIAEMKTMTDVFKGMNANPKSGKPKISSSRGVDNVSSNNKASTMLRSMSLQHKNSQVSSDNTNSDNELTNYRCYSIYDDLHDKIAKKQKHKTTEIVVEVNFTLCT
jgi:hypothetical protein